MSYTATDTNTKWQMSCLEDERQNRGRQQTRRQISSLPRSWEKWEEHPLHLACELLLSLSVLRVLVLALVLLILAPLLVLA